ncbi:MAG TPA: SDR family NAD(P)-dependent oxidoreductase [Actinophytocola sp.]|uniref:SDR family oxidoreductase n=1 Tax=Actinophytocola sp. TaxID=1872138 RepID=UPI002DDD068E|nr:SDR family NAD(P)-dependent oxidoreductase [Actinophytocola sp.]HEV2778971.1 SDR family NAD(P)-dependent oxidoreductase [Actinophytocola sp.]
MRLAGRVALVTGSSSGMGAAIAVALAREGASVSLTARRGDRLAEVVEKITTDGGVASHVVADVADREQAANAVSSTVDRYGRLDIVINSAGGGTMGPVEGADLDMWHHMVNVNLLGVLNVTHAAVPHLLRQSYSDLLVISSHSGRLTTPFNNVYAATKFGVVAFCDSMRQEMADKGLRVTVIEPGMTRGTEITNASNDPELQKFVLDFLANKVTLSPEDIAATVLHMVSAPPNVTLAEVLILPTSTYTSTRPATDLDSASP